MTYIDLTKLSEKLGGRSRSSIYRDVEAGRLPTPIKLGRRIYWCDAAIDRALASLNEGAE